MKHMNHIMIIMVHVVLIVTLYLCVGVTAIVSCDVFAIGYNIIIVYLKLTSGVIMQYH